MIRYGHILAVIKVSGRGTPLPLFFSTWQPTVFAKMIFVAQQNDLLVRLADNIVPKGIAMLQYADDTILLIQDNLEQARNLKLMLYIFEAMSSLKINFEKKM
jgi:hypothetical protein